MSGPVKPSQSCAYNDFKTPPPKPPAAAPSSVNASITSSGMSASYQAGANTTVTGSYNPLNGRTTIGFDHKF
jgi:hypothetical protein